MQVLQSPRLFTMSYMCSVEKHIKGPIYCDWILSYNRITFLTALSQQMFRIVSAKRDLTHVFFNFNFYFRNLRSPLHIVSYSLTIEVSVMELKGAEFLISHAFQRKRYISIARIGNFMMYALGPDLI